MPFDNRIHVDDRIGSKEVAPILSSYLSFNCPVRRLEFGDFFFMAPQGGPGDDVTTVGIERKRIRDMIQSVMSGRLSGSQLPGMAETYDFTFLIIEGDYVCNPYTKKLEIKNAAGRYTDRLWNNRSLDYRTLDASINTIRLKTNVQVIKTYSIQHTAMEVFHLWSWFNSKPWSKHSSHIAFPHLVHEGPISNVPGKPTYFRRMIKELPHIGWDRSSEAEHLFNGDLRRAVNADVETWNLIKGVSVKRAEEIVKAITVKGSK